MDPEKLPVTVVLDLGFTSLLQSALKIVAHVCLPTAGVVALWLTYEGLFAHGEGFLELSRIEWAAIFLFLLVERRGSNYHRKLGYGWWHGLFRTLGAIGLCSLVWTLVVGLGAIAERESGGASHSVLADMEASVWLQPLWFASLLFSVYVAVPTRSAGSHKTNPESTCRVEPTPGAVGVESQP